MPQTAPSPTTRHPARVWAALVASGLGWGATGPFSKLAVSTGNHPIGVSFWTALSGALVLAAILLGTRRRLPLERRHLVFFAVCGLLGTALPNTLSYTAYRHLPIGVMVIVIALVPMATVLIAVPLGVDRAEPRRIIGLGVGAVAVLLIALPETSLPDPAQAAWVALPVIVALSYAAENVYIAAARPPGCDALTVLCGLSWAALALLTPTAIAADAFFDITRLGAAELAIFANTALHLCAYFAFIWLVGQAGPVFAAQVGYVVTGSGVVLGMLVYGERHSPWVWGALALMLAGLALVRPRR